MLLSPSSSFGVLSPSLPFRAVLLFTLSLVGGGAAFSSVLLGGAALSTPLCVVLLCPFPSVGWWIVSKSRSGAVGAHDVSRKVRPHRSYHVCILWHLQYLSTAVLCSTCPPQRGVVAKTLRHSISTHTQALKHLAATESNATITPNGSLVPPALGFKMYAAH